MEIDVQGMSSCHAPMHEDQADRIGSISNRNTPKQSFSPTSTTTQHIHHKVPTYHQMNYKQTLMPSTRISSCKLYPLACSSQS